MTALTITYDETHRGIALWVQTRAEISSPVTASTGSRVGLV